MTLFEFYTNLRKDVLKQISGVEDSNGYFSWDNTTPNYLIKIRLESLLADYIVKAKEFGIYVVTRYARCARSAHEGYPTENRYGLDIPYQDDQFVWGADQLFQGERISTCPCSTKNKPHKNYVIDDIIYKKSYNEKDCKIISSIFCDISEAINNAADKKARSGIREHLLRAILRLNDAVLPMPVDEYISTALHKNA
ncbi:hypothetical protein [Zestomonas thermotolerans]|uniref:hypothetical protein n=1 Tax=Zestomonas thermotolerans TaxID=157784 RepID=UPI0012DE42CD|nr:hypothetical protein [Pseudomonas thermotolerans]